MQVVILAGGRGSRIAEETAARPKPMIEIGGKPLLWHLMKHYAHHGFKDFIICLGYRGDVIRNYFLGYHAMNSDVLVRVGNGATEVMHSFHDEDDWTVLLAETGPDTQTAGRIARVAKYIKGDRFMITYGDGLANVDLGRLLEAHVRSGKLVTVTGVRPVARFGELVVRGDQVTQFREKPQTTEGWINGGFFVVEREALRYLDKDEPLERRPLERIASDGQLSMYRHEGYWRAMDTLREKEALEEEWAGGRPGWKTW
jgi:glucose-1-phosphate cytidylyltransferase